MTLAQDRSLDLLVSSPLRYYCTTDAPANEVNFIINPVPGKTILMVKKVLYHVCIQYTSIYISEHVKTTMHVRNTVDLIAQIKMVAIRLTANSRQF